jgi:hypothetical protein
MVACQYLGDSVNLSGFQRDLSQLVATSAPTIQLTDCYFFDNDMLAPAGTCTASGIAPEVTAIAEGLDLKSVAVLGDASRLDEAGCKAQPRFSSIAATDTYVSVSRRAHFAYVAVLFHRASGAVCVEARTAWG